MSAEARSRRGRNASPAGERPRRIRFGLWRLMTAPLARRKSRALLSVTALALSATLVTALLTFYRGVEENLGGAFRRSGANLIVTAGGAGQLDPAAADSALRSLAPAASGAGVLYAIGAANNHAIVLAGAKLDALATLNAGWRVYGRLPREGEAWLGVNAARLLGCKPGDSITVGQNDGRQTWRVVGLVDSGGSEDNQVLAPLATLEALTGLQGYTTLEVRAQPNAAAMAAAGALLARQLPGARIRPVRPIAAGEGAIVLHTRNLLLAVSGLILLTVGLCVAAALTTLAVERRRDFGIMKALGGGEGSVLASFVGESAVMGAIAAVLGVTAGALIAGAMGHLLFGLWFNLRLTAAAAAAVVTLALAVTAALAPWPIVRRATPAAILRGN